MVFNPDICPPTLDNLADPDSPVHFDIEIQQFLAFFASQRHFRELFQHKLFYMLGATTSGSDGAVYRCAPPPTTATLPPNW